MPQMQKLGKAHTTIAKIDSKLIVTYHSTAIVIVDYTNNTIKLDTGGWFTSSTQWRMNQASNQFELGFAVYRKKGLWYVNYQEMVLDFNKDSIVFPI